MLEKDPGTINGINFDDLKKKKFKVPFKPMVPKDENITIEGDGDNDGDDD